MLAVLAVPVESRAAEPLVPPRIVRERTTALAIVASLAVGVAMFGRAIFLGQYFQVARGYSPTAVGLLTTPMMLGSFAGSVGAGQLITRFGRWKRYLILGSLLLVIGLGLLGTIDDSTPLWQLSLFMLAMGLGMGADAARPLESGGSGTSVLDLKDLPPQVAEVVRHASGDATGQIFAIGAVVAVVSLLAVLLIREIPAPPDRRQALTGVQR